MAIRLHREGDATQAKRIYKRVLRAQPSQPDALHYLGVLKHQEGESDAAVDLIRRAITASPDYIDAHNNLGNVLRDGGEYEQAEACYREVVSINPEYGNAYNNLGVVLRAQDRLDESADAYRRAIELKPNDADQHYNLGNTFRDAHQFEDAIVEYRRAIELDPDHIAGHKNLGIELYRLGKRDEAAEVYRHWLERSPDDPTARHMLAANTGESVPGRASDGFVQKLFDAFAGSFDQNLERLGYRAPELVGGAIAAQLGEAVRGMCVLDAGCGTGLCGPLLGPYAARLVGVDLSPRMVEMAKNRRVYDDLIVAELTAFMSGVVGEYDLIVSADTLVYFGDLRTVLAGGAGALRDGGLLVFTVEQVGEGEAVEGFRLNHHGRYSHTRGYVERTLMGAGLEVISVTVDVLRKESGQPVEGLVVTARKGAS